MRNKMTILMLFLATTIVYAEQTNSGEKQGHHVGFAIGGTIGMGLSYRWMRETWGFQATLLPIVSSHSAHVILGLTGMRGLHSTRHTQLFLYMSVSGGIGRETTLYADATLHAYRVEYGGWWTIVNVGGGPGMNFFLYDHVVLSVMGGYAVYNGFSAEQPWRFDANFTAEVALLYRW